MPVVPRLDVTAREHAVLRLAVSDYTNTEAAARLGITPNAVRLRTSRMKLRNRIRTPSHLYARYIAEWCGGILPAIAPPQRD